MLVSLLAVAQGLCNHLCIDLQYTAHLGTAAEITRYWVMRPVLNRIDLASAERFKVQFRLTGDTLKLDYSTLSPVDVAVLCLRNGEEALWSEFIRRFNPLICAIVARVARNWGDDSLRSVDDLVQETYLKLCAERTRVLSRFDPAHPDSIFGYLKVFAANLAHDHFRSLHAKKRGHVVTTEQITDGGDGKQFTVGNSNNGTGAIENFLLMQEIDGLLRKSDSGPTAVRDRQIFWLYYRIGLTAAAISALPGIGLTTKGVESTILRLTRNVRKFLSTEPHKTDLKPEDSPTKGCRTADSF